MIVLGNSLVIEATQEAEIFTFYSPDLPGFTAVGHSVEGCRYQATLAMAEHTAVLAETGRLVSPPSMNPTLVRQRAHPLNRAA